MRGRGWWWVGVVVAIVIPACAHRMHVRESNVTATGGNYLVPLTGTTWRVETLGAEAAVITAASRTALRIGGDGHVTGSTGCNSFSGTATIDGSSLTFSPLVTTKRECEPPVMETETAILNALQSTRTWAMDGKYLGLLDDHGHYVMKLVRAKG